MKIRIFFTNYVDLDNFNAQSLNVREIALRLNPQLFESTLFYERTPDPRLLNQPSIRLVKIPRRLGTVKIFQEFFRGQDIIFRANLIRFTYLYLLMPGFLRRGAKIIEWFEGPDNEYVVWQPHYLKIIYKALISRVEDRIAMTEYTAESLYKAYGFKSASLIPVGVDTHFFTPPEGRDNNPPNVLFVGTLIERKKPDSALIAARLFPEANFIIVGGRRGDYYLLLKELVDKWKLKNVTILDPMPHSHLVNLMRKCDIFFHPSLVESISKVIIEAGATGMPGIMLDTYRSPAMLNGVTGFQVKNLERMLEKLELLLADRDLRLKMGAAAVEYAQQFDWDVITKQWEQKFLELTEKQI